jgi:hypothetical protein
MKVYVARTGRIVFVNTSTVSSRWPPEIRLRLLPAGSETGSAPTPAAATIKVQASTGPVKIATCAEHKNRACLRSDAHDLLCM